MWLEQVAMTYLPKTLHSAKNATFEQNVSA
jgi:hypothetical protein